MIGATLRDWVCVLKPVLNMILVLFEAVYAQNSALREWKEVDLTKDDLT
jgi:hypothetical protein